MNTEMKINELIKKYAKSIDEASLEIASEVWLNSQDVSFIHPKGHQHGFDEICENFIVGTFGRLFSKREVNIFDVSINIYDNSAVVEFYWHFIATFKEDGSKHETRGRESQVYIKTEEYDWSLIHVHYSSMPVLGEREGF